MACARRLWPFGLLLALRPASPAPLAAAAPEACGAADEPGEEELLHVSLLQRGRPALQRKRRPRGGLFGFLMQPEGNASGPTPGQGVARAGGLELVSPPECQEDHASDVFRPVREVLAEHRGVDGFCYFGFRGFWSWACAVAHRRQDYTPFPAVAKYSASITGSLQTVHYDGGTFRSENHVFLYQDLYCHANGWLQGQGLPHGLMGNYTAWSELAAAECRQLDGRFPESQMSVIDMDTRMEAEMQALQDAMDRGTEVPTTLDMRRHAAVKCAMGGLGCDMAYCNALCLRSDGTIGRTSSQCEGQA